MNYIKDKPNVTHLKREYYIILLSTQHVDCKSDSPVLIFLSTKRNFWKLCSFSYAFGIKASKIVPMTVIYFFFTSCGIKRFLRRFGEMCCFPIFRVIEIGSGRWFSIRIRLKQNQSP